MARHAVWPDVSPLIDILLVLVIVFTSGAVHPIRYVLYAGVADASFDRWPAVTVVAGRNETMLIDGHPCRPAELRGRTVRLIADSGAVYQDVVHALDVARGAGARVLLELPRHP